MTLQNDDIPTVKFTNLTAAEGGSANEALSLSKPYNAPITVTLNTSNATAVAPGDYTPLVGTQITFPAASTAPITVPIAIHADGVLGEKLEKFNVTATSIAPSVMHIVYISANNT